MWDMALSTSATNVIAYSDAMSDDTSAISMAQFATHCRDVMAKYAL